MAELADAHGSGPCEHCAHEGSSPFSCTGIPCIWKDTGDIFVLQEIVLQLPVEQNMNGQVAERKVVLKRTAWARQTS